MGLPMARRVVGQGFDVRGYDVRPEPMAALAQQGAGQADTPRAAAEGADVLALMVATPEQAESALYGDAGAAQGLREGAAVLLLATVGRANAVALGERLAERGVALLDAPVSGGVARAEVGDLLIMAGGPTELFERLRPLLGAMGSTVVHCGEAVGDGQSVKLVNQLLCGVHIAAAAEALAYAQALGLDPAAVREVIRHGAAASFMLEDRGQRMLDRAFGSPKSALGIFVKDMGLVEEAGGERGAHTPLAHAAREAFEEGAARGLEHEDDSGVIRVFESPDA